MWESVQIGTNYVGHNEFCSLNFDPERTKSEKNCLRKTVIQFCKNLLKNKFQDKNRPRNCSI